MRIDVRTNFAAVRRELDRLPGKVREVAMARALNRTVEQAKTAMSREIRGEFNVGKQDVDRKLVIRKAFATRTGLRLTAELRGLGQREGKRAWNVIRFVEKSVSLAQARKRRKAGQLDRLGVRIKRGGGVKLLKAAFIANRGRTVFERIGRERLPIRPVQTIDVPQMFNARRINARVVRAIEERFATIFAREAKFALSQFSTGRI